MEHIKAFTNVITYLEEQGWEYSVTFDGKLELYLGNSLRSVSKYDTEMMIMMLDELEYW